MSLAINRSNLAAQAQRQSRLSRYVQNLHSRTIAPRKSRTHNTAPSQKATAAPPPRPKPLMEHTPETSNTQDARWYVAQIRAGQEAATLALCRQMVGPEAMQDCFAPECEFMWKTPEGWQLRRRLLFPGYLFFVSGNVQALFEELKRVPAFTRLLGDDARKGTASFFPLTEDERDWFLAFTDTAHVVRMSQGYITGECVKITRGPLMGCEGIITKIDRHKRRAYIDVNLFGRTVPASIGLEIVRKTA